MEASGAVDSTATSMCMDNNIELVVFNMNENGNIVRAIKGEKIGTAEAGVEYEMLEAEEKWYKIRLDSGEEGWITSGMAEIIE